MMTQVMQSAFVLLAKLIVWIRPAVPIICAVMAWTITVILIFNIVVMVRQGIANARKMHRIPCANCRYATESYRLKCSVHPVEAFSEQAISCQDFSPEGFAPNDFASS